jgi:rhodanese-related sulfurtransferase/DNA-binding transcriptional ArsR family regulator
VDAARKRVFKDQLFEQFARIGKALASGPRLELLELLAQGERSVESLARDASLSMANASQHLHVLRRTRLVEVRRDGNYIYYRLADDRTLQTWLSLRDLATARLAEIDQIVDSFLSDRKALEPVTAEQLRRRLKDVLVLDVRPRPEYEAGHIATARSIPVTELAERIKELPKRHEIIAYCRGPYCVFADEAVALLRSRGYRAFRLEGGFPEWRASGLPVELRLNRVERRA